MRRANRLIFNDQPHTPLGRLISAGFREKEEAHIFQRQNMRVMGNYSVTYLISGSGSYSDSGDFKQGVRAGDLIVIFPELAHRYGPRRHDKWNELYVTFEGPIFDLLREQKVLDPAQPVLRLSPVTKWLPRLEEILLNTRPCDAGEATAEVARFVDLLVQMVAPRTLGRPTPGDSQWLLQTKKVLEYNLSEPLDLHEVAKQVGMSYERFRKEFAQKSGTPPARYRARCRIAAACSMLAEHSFPIKTVALRTGYSDVFQFFKRFKQFTGCTPSEYRKRNSKRLKS
jgi:AraC-like DNA-binding protein